MALAVTVILSRMAPRRSRESYGGAAMMPCRRAATLPRCRDEAEAEAGAGAAAATTPVFTSMHHYSLLLLLLLRTRKCTLRVGVAPTLSKHSRASARRLDGTATRRLGDSETRLFDYSTTTSTRLLGYCIYSAIRLLGYCIEFVLPHYSHPEVHLQRWRRVAKVLALEDTHTRAAQEGDAAVLLLRHLAKKWMHACMNV